MEFPERIAEGLPLSESVPLLGVVHGTNKPETARDKLYRPPLPSDPDSKWIRVLDLYAGDVSSSKPLCGALRLAHLRDAPKFAALSYVWGSRSSSDYTITCNGVQLEITDNCHEALKSLRDNHGPVTIWVDSICINQSNEEEKASQISLMEDIYTFAQPTYIWLGSGSKASDNAIEYIKFKALWTSEKPGIPWEYEVKRRRIYRDLLKEALHTMIYLPNVLSCCIGFWGYGSKRQLIDDLPAFLETDWLYRTWTFQEIILSSHLVLLRGDKYLDWRTFCRTASKDHKRHSPFYRWNTLIHIWEQIPRPLNYSSVLLGSMDQNKICSINSYRSTTILSAAQFVIPSLIVIMLLIIAACGYWANTVLTVKYKTSDYKGNCFSQADCETLVNLFSYGIGFGGAFLYVVYLGAMIVSYCSHEAGVPGKISSKFARELWNNLIDRHASDPKDKSFAFHGILNRLDFQPGDVDYELPLGQLYMELLVMLLKKNPYLIGSLALCGNPALNGPSWTPDWSIDIDILWSLRHIKSAVALFSEDYVRPEVEIHGKKLKVTGIWRGRITSCFKNPGLFPTRQRPYSTEQDPIHMFIVIMEVVDSIRQLLLVKSSLTPKRAIDIILNTVSIDPNRKTKYEGYRSLPHYCQTILERAVADPNSLSTEDALAVSHEYPEIFEFLQRVSNNADRIGHAFFTESTSDIGLGPAEAMEGDFLANIVGVAVPLILRRSSQELECYKIIGAAYVRDLMQWGYYYKTHFQGGGREDTLIFDRWLWREPAAQRIRVGKVESIILV